jgi:hypothetical protein
VDRRKRPVIDKTERGEDGENRPFIDQAAVEAAANVMSDARLAKGARGEGHTTAYKRLLRCCIAVAAPPASVLAWSLSGSRSVLSGSTSSRDGM